MQKQVDSMQEQYVQWVKETLVCSACNINVPQQAQYLVNCNIRPSLTDQPHKSRPQPGYLGEDYLRYRVLVLGKNPAWPNSEAVDIEYFKTVQMIQDVKSLKVCTPTLLRMHSNWTPLKELNLRHHVGLQPAEIAYANQILCRSDSLKPDKPKERGAVAQIAPKAIQAIYDSCFENRICKLIEILEPQHIVTIGKLDNTEFSWPHILERLLGRRSQFNNVRVWPVRFPTWQGGYTKEAHNDISGLREVLGIVT